MRLSLVASLLLGSSVVMASPAQAGLPTVAQLCQLAGCDAAALAKVQAGQLVQLSPKDASERDLAVGFVFLVKRPPAEVARLFRQGGDLGADAHVLRSHRVSAAAEEADFATLTLAPKAAEEAHRYLAARPGDEFNLSDREIAGFRQLGSAATPADVEARLREQLRARYQAYRTGGLAGVPPYARAKGQVRSPADELRGMVTQAAPLLEQYAPAFWTALANYPRQRPPGLDEAYHWLVYDLDDRPTAILRHRMTLAIGDGLVALDREFYVAHGYNAMQALGALVPVAGGTMIFYAAHTSTDQAGGAASAMKHGIGRKVMAKQLEAIFEHFTR